MNMYENIDMMSLEYINTIQRLQADVFRLTIENEKLLNKIAKIQFELDDVVSEWISVKDMLPERGAEVLVTDGLHTMVTWCEDTADGVKWVDNYYTYVNVRFKEVTHWMPLPEPPESEDGE